ncbi:ATP-binding protein [Terracidiphilus gabretensis]|uniref:ATP-binding protein n=1 Tax=Terracidiphilus gabretensis TaxID=1577687 RepID=UPI0012F98A5F|nr:ATP-binding protein [Terracidiphilus gabretensis]
MRQTDWAATPLGPVDQWPQSLRTCVRIILTSRQPMFIWWGDDLINLHNDAYKSILGGKHPTALGQPARLVWHEIWDQVGPRAEFAMRTNEGTYDESLLLMMERNGYREETYYTFSYSPVPNDQGGTGGIICANTDDTDRIISQRQIAALRDVAFRTADARNWREVCKLTAESLRTSRDVRFGLIYISAENQSDLELAGTVRVAEEDATVPGVIRREEANRWPIAEVIRSNDIRIVSDAQYLFPQTAESDEGESVECAAIVPISQVGNTAHNGVLIVGLNPFRLPDDNYKGFLKMLASQIGASIANAEAYEQERRRAEALADLDRAKTIFFSNVSHEFRTPLTLMLAPLEDLLARRSELAPADVANIETTHRNGTRLLKLVNTLLDFSRIEAGRISARYRRVNLGEYTAELASIFRSAMEKAGLRYTIECNLSDEAAYVDPAMWEKIVLNLISNAFKFTLSGEVRAALEYRDGRAEFSVADSGAGISEQELPRIFDRFHRVEGAIGRTHEGTGIGLALVSELARLHGGEVRVESKLGSGSTFTVSIPTGRQHLPADKMAGDEDELALREGSTAFVQEALRWLPDEVSEVEAVGDPLGAHACPVLPSADDTSVARPRILLADDNRDMLEYLQRLLSRRFDVTAVSDGQQALEAVLKQPPDLVLTDVMMPRLDGFGLLRALRSHAETAAIPIVMLSARAGEEAEAEGLEAGADDYLVKPFTARELLARVQTHVSMHQLRTELTAREQELRRKAEDAEYRYRSMLESISEAFIFVDRDWRICYANSQYAALIGVDIPPLLGKNLWEVFPEAVDTAFAQMYRLAMSQGTVKRLEDYYAPLEKWFQVNAYPSADGLSIFLMDVTNRKEKEQKLLLTEKLAATGRLAATIAHEINNPLESVLNLIYLARISRGSIEKIRDYLATAEKEVARVSHIARHTLGFYRDTSRPVLINLPSLIDEVLLVYETRLRASAIDVVKSLSDIRPIEALKGEFHQVFSNLISNSIDAMPSGGAISISVREVEEEIHITVADTGRGIPQEHQSRAGEPFFTTKQGSGTGLGLWIVNQFVKGWGGMLQISSNTDEANHGTSITITLPATFVSPSQKSNQSSQHLM